MSRVDSPPPLANPVRGNSGQRDTRGYGAAYVPGPSDLQAGFDVKREMRRGRPVDFNPPQRGPQQQLGPDPFAPESTVQGSYPGVITAVGIANAILLCPKNTGRKGLIIANPSPAGGQISFSFNAPNQLTGTIGGGIPINAGSFYEKSGGTIAVDAIYVWSDDPTANFPIGVIVFEGVPVSS